MKWQDVLGALRRRWYVAIVGLLASAAGVVGVIGLVPPTYTASGSVLLLPAVDDVSEGQNPFLELANLDVPASIVAAYLDSDTARAAIEAAAPTAKYTISLDPTLRGPVVFARVENTTSANTLEALELVLDSVPEALGTLQSSLDVPDGATITSMRLAVDTKTVPVTSTTQRVAFLVGIAGLAATAGLAMLVDRIALRRRAQRPERAAARAARAEQAAERAAQREAKRAAEAAEAAKRAEQAEQAERAEQAKRAPEAAKRAEQAERAKRAEQAQREKQLRREWRSRRGGKVVGGTRRLAAASRTERAAPPPRVPTTSGEVPQPDITVDVQPVLGTTRPGDLSWLDALAPTTTSAVPPDDAG